MVYTGNSRDDILDLFYCQRPDTLIERDRMDRLRKKIRKDNFGGSVSEPILNHKMNQYRYYVKLYENFIASANMSVFTPMII